MSVPSVSAGTTWTDTTTTTTEPVWRSRNCAGTARVLVTAAFTLTVDDLARLMVEARRREGWTQAELGARLGRSESWVSQVERGARRVDRMSVRWAIAETIGVRLETPPDRLEDMTASQLTDLIVRAAHELSRRGQAGR